MDISPLRAPSHLLWLPRCPYTADMRLRNWKNRVVMRGMIHLCWRSHQGQASPSSTPWSPQWRKTLGQQPNTHPYFYLPSFYTERERGEDGSWEDLELRHWYFNKERRCVQKYQSKPFYDSMKGIYSLLSIGRQISCLLLESRVSACVIFFWEDIYHNHNGSPFLLLFLFLSFHCLAYPFPTSCLTAAS